jgi:tRNA threonylcarbamoyladenosine biosynthesis protein TsaE
MHTADGNRSTLPLTGHLADEANTLELGAALAVAIEAGVIIHLHGDLGAGKTTLVRGCLRRLGVHEKVKSPTYTLVELYSLSRLNFYHFDFYRFKTPSEWDATGFREYFNPESVCVVEWPEKAGSRLPLPDLRLHLGIDAAGRSFAIAAESERGVRCLGRLCEAWKNLPNSPDG